MISISTKKVLTIAGSDSLSGGGLQADLRTFQEYGVKGLNALTCIVTVEPETDQITVHEVSEKMLRSQLEECLNQEVAVDVIKIGMLANLETAKIVAEYLKQVNKPIVLDPVLALKESGLTSGQDIVNFFNQELMPLAIITTPNLKEAELLSGIKEINSLEKMKEAAQVIHKTGVKHVVIKGGQRLPGNTAYDVFYDGVDFLILQEKKLENGFNNGAGCTFASAIASGISLDYPMKEAVIRAKEFVYEGIQYGIPFLPGLGNVYQGGKNKQ